MACITQKKKITIHYYLMLTTIYNGLFKLLQSINDHFIDGFPEFNFIIPVILLLLLTVGCIIRKGIRYILL